MYIQVCSRVRTLECWLFPLVVFSYSLGLLIFDQNGLYFVTMRREYSAEIICIMHIVFYLNRFRFWWTVWMNGLKLSARFSEMPRILPISLGVIYLTVV